MFKIKGKEISLNPTIRLERLPEIREETVFKTKILKVMWKSWFNCYAENNNSVNVGWPDL